MNNNHNNFPKADFKELKEKAREALGEGKPYQAIENYIKASNVAEDEEEPYLAFKLREKAARQLYLLGETSFSAGNIEEDDGLRDPETDIEEAYELLQEAASIAEDSGSLERALKFYVSAAELAQACAQNLPVEERDKWLKLASQGYQEGYELAKAEGKDLEAKKSQEVMSKLEKLIEDPDFNIAEFED